MKRYRLLAVASLALILAAFSFSFATSSAPPSDSQPPAETAPPPPTEQPQEGFVVRCC